MSRPITPAPDLLREQAYIAGRWCGAADDRTFPVHDPATGDTIAEVADLGPADARRAIEAAEGARISWSRGYPAKERSRILRRWFDLIIERQDDLARLLTTEQGKPLAEAIGEIAFGAAYVEFYAEEAKRVYGEVIPSDRTDRRIVILREPVGVVAAITPWNFPFAMITRKIAPALAAGCPVVLKPAEQTPLTALALTVLAEQAGFPEGVINVVTTSDPAPVGRELATNRMVRGLTFTGSTEIGRLLMAQAADTVTRVSLELGGNAPFIVFADADLDAAVAGAIASKFRASGQTCVCANRIFVQDTVYDEFADRFVAAVRALRVGSGFEPGVQIGPLIDERAVAKVERHVEEALVEGARLLTGGTRLERGGAFYCPTVLGDVRPTMTVAREETFGPVAPLLRFRDEADVLDLANATEYGLAANVFTRDLARAWRMGDRLEYGTVGINTGVMSSELGPAGGMKQSGLGREGARMGIEEFVETKYLCIGALD